MNNLLKELRGVKGYDQLTQGEKETEKLLTKYYESLHGKRLAFVATRTDCLKQRFNERAMSRYIDIVATNSTWGGLDDLTRMYTVKLMEEVVRDEVCLCVAETLFDATKYRIFFYNGDLTLVMQSYRNYYTNFDHLVSVGHTYRERIEEVTKRSGYFYEPEKWTNQQLRQFAV
jgi:hypothetical protein